MKILLLSAYDAQSHRYWRESLSQCLADHQWTQLTLPARYFSWRVRGNALSWAFSEREVLAESYDLLIATSMVDLATLRGLVPTLGHIPTLVYFHENQFVYPASAQQHKSVEPELTSLYTALAGDLIVFNSDYNRSSFLQGADTLLKKLPDHVPPNIAGLLEEKSTVIPVPLEPEAFQNDRRQGSGNGPLQIVWNHRWEYDKGPERLLKAIERLIEKTQNFCLHVVGQQFRQQPAAFEQLHEMLKAMNPGLLGQWGYLTDRKQYQYLLANSDVVLSTALHDFQGIAVLEGVAAGALPLVPERLCYTQWFAKKFCYPSFVDDSDAEAEALAEQLLRLAEEKQQGTLTSAPSVDRFKIERLKTDYERAFEQSLASK